MKQEDQIKNPYKEFDEYGLRHVSAHLIEIDLWEEYKRFLTGFHFLDTKTCKLRPQPLLEDNILGVVPTNPLSPERVEILKLIQEAIRLSFINRSMTFKWATKMWNIRRKRLSNCPVYRQPFELLAVTNREYQRKKAAFTSESDLRSVWLPVPDSNIPTHKYRHMA